MTYDSEIAKSIAETALSLIDEMNFAIAEELLREVNPNITHEKIQEMMTISNGNPWDAQIIYQLTELSNGLSQSKN